MKRTETVEMVYLSAAFFVGMLVGAGLLISLG